VLLSAVRGGDRRGSAHRRPFRRVRDIRPAACRTPPPFTPWKGRPGFSPRLMPVRATRHGLKPVTTETRDLFRRPLLPSELVRYDALVIDPPRAGAEAQTREIAEAQVPRIAAVSCNPVTFARDAAILVRAGYRLNWVQPVDQFRWSSHVELAASLSLAHIDG
jgi:plasmid stability protein